MGETHAALQVFSATFLRSQEAPIAEELRAPIEAPLALELNGQVVAHLMRMPGDDAELALGYCLTEGYIEGFQDVISLQVCEEERGLVRVQTRGQVTPQATSVLISACVGGRLPDGADWPPPLLPAGPPFSREMLLQLTRRLHEAQTVHLQAGAVHGAAAFTREGELLVVREDVGRHNALDKVVGYCLYHGRPADALLATTGRASSEMVLKAARARFPVALSRSGPTSLGIELAARLGLTLICYARGNRMTIYTHRERVEGF
ncbi:MAG: formate dehydrogenase accessory sulfurtransferase FdhD [Candidatus Zipacnadales bacterium]